MSVDAPREGTEADEVTITHGRSELSIEREFAAGDLGRIQDILIGDHLRRVDERFDRLASEGNKQVSELTAELAAQSEHHAAELAVLHAELSEERAARLDAGRVADEERAALIAELEELRVNHRDFVVDANRRMAEMAEAAAIQVNAARADFAARLDKAVTTIGAAKMDRIELATMFRQGAAMLESDENSGA